MRQISLHHQAEGIDSRQMIQEEVRASTHLGTMEEPVAEPVCPYGRRERGRCGFHHILYETSRLSNQFAVHVGRTGGSEPEYGGRLGSTKEFLFHGWQHKGYHHVSRGDNHFEKP